MEAPEAAKRPDRNWLLFGSGFGVWGSEFAALFRAYSLCKSYKVVVGSVLGL